MTRYERAIERLRTARPKTAQEASAEAGVDFATVNPNLAAIVEEAYLEAWEPGELRRAPRSPWHGPRGRWLTVYATGLAFGGPEEGGWWYTAGARTEYVDVTGKNWREEADRLRAVYAARIDPRGLSPSDSIGGIEIHGPSTYPGAERFPSERQVYS